MMYANRQKSIENKPNRNNIAPKDYEDESNLCVSKHGDSNQLRDLRGKMKILIGKLAQSKKQRETGQKQIERLNNEVAMLQDSLRHTVAGFSNSSSNFPMGNQLANKVADFYKCACLDIFFDFLGPEELTLKGIIYFYFQVFKITSSLVQAHFAPAFNLIMKVGCLESIQGPVMNVLRKSFQAKHMNIIEAIADRNTLTMHAQTLIDNLGISCMEKEEAIDQIITFMQKLIQITLECRISDPPFNIQIQNIGKRIEYNTLSHDPFDGFIKPKSQCFIILPQVRRQDGEIVAKSLVLHQKYDLSN